MDKKELQKIIIISVINYVVILLVSFVISIIFPGLFSIIWLAITIISVFLFVYYYYFQTRPLSPLKEGIILGGLLALFTFVIELTVWYSSFGWLYFGNFIVLLQYFLIIIVPVIAALMKKEVKYKVAEKVSTRGTNWKNRLND